MNIGQDLVIGHCRKCGQTVRMAWAGQEKRGRSWYGRFRFLDDAPGGSRAHVCPRGSQVKSTRRDPVSPSMRGRGGWLPMNAVEREKV